MAAMDETEREGRHGRDEKGWRVSRFHQLMPKKEGQNLTILEDKHFVCLPSWVSADDKMLLSFLWLWLLLFQAKLGWLIDGEKMEKLLDGRKMIREIAILSLSLWARCVRVHVCVST